MLAGCGGGSGDELKGTWAGKNNDDVEVTWTFDGKGECTMENAYGTKDSGTYTIEGGSVSIKLNNWDEALGYKFTISGSSLSLKPDMELRPSYELTKE
jgi:hypothetical protein